MAVVHLGFISLESSQRPFYPERLFRAAGRRGADLLPFYASKLGTIEMTSVNYSIPSPQVAQQWVDSVPSGFIIHVKLFGLFTFGRCSRNALPRSVLAMMQSESDHVELGRMPLEAVDEVWRCFRAFLSPIRDAGKLGLVMCQFTASFVPKGESYARLRQVCQQCLPTRVAAEFRSPDWASSQQAAEVLHELGVVSVITDDNGSYNKNNNFRQMPDLLTGSTLGYCRIHRRPLNLETGLICENVTEADMAASMEPDPTTGRCTGDLSPAEVDEWVFLLREASSRLAPGSQIFVHVSTVGRNSSADNVARLRAALGPLAAPWPEVGAPAADAPAGDQPPFPAGTSDEESRASPANEAEVLGHGSTVSPESCQAAGHLTGDGAPRALPAEKPQVLRRWRRGRAAGEDPAPHLVVPA